jgi:hypothetical protein
MHKRKLLFIVLLFFITQSILANDTIICKGKSIKLISPRLGNYTYLWSTGETTSSITVNPAQTTEYTIESFSTVQSFIDKIVVIVDDFLPPPIINFSLDKIISTTSLVSKIRWVKDNKIILGITIDTLKFPLRGVYRSEISNLGGCWTPSQSIYVAQDTDTARINYSSIVYPNPSTGYFNLILNLPRKVSKNIEIKIQDVNGAKVFELKQFVFHSTNVKFPIRLPAGIKGQLILTISVNGILTTQQVVIQ